MNIIDLQQKLSPIFQNYGITRASVFGSISRGEAGPESDIDLLVKLGKPMGMFKYMDLIEEIEEKLHRKVDLLTEGNVNKFLEPYIRPDLKTIYED